MNDKKYVILYTQSGEVVSLMVTREKIHIDQETGFVSFTDLNDNYVQWNGLVLISSKPIRLHDKPEVTERG